MIHDNDVERLRQLLAEYPALLSWQADKKGRGVLGMATSAYAFDVGNAQRERSRGDIGGIPDVLSRLGFHHSRTALLYALGHEAMLREEGWIPNEETPEKVAELFAALASQPASENPRGHGGIFSERELQTYESKVLGIRVEVFHRVLKRRSSPPRHVEANFAPSRWLTLGLQDLSGKLAAPRSAPGHSRPTRGHGGRTSRSALGIFGLQPKYGVR